MTLNVPVREDILTSWQRCVVAGLRPDHFEVPYQPDFDHDGSQVELARVIEQCAARARTIAAVDDTRQRIERDLHDGLQQRLGAAR